MTANTPMKIGPTKYSEGGLVHFAHYGSDETAIVIMTEDGEQELKATVALVPYGAEHPGKNGVWLKDWSENEGVAQALVDAGVVTLTGKIFPTGFVEALHAELTPAALEHLNRIRGGTNADAS